MIRILVLKSHFSSAHLYKNEDFSTAENKKYFGRCFTDFGHGHNYCLEVGFQMKLSFSEQDLFQQKTKLQQAIEKLTSHLDHEHLNFAIPEFKKVVPTTENILLYFENKISKLRLRTTLSFLKLFESENLWSEKYYVTK